MRTFQQHESRSLLTSHTSYRKYIQRGALGKRPDSVPSAFLGVQRDSRRECSEGSTVRYPRWPLLTCNHGSRPAARYFLFHFTCVVTTVITAGLCRMRWISGFTPALDIFPSNFLFPHSVSPYITPLSHHFFVAVVTRALCSVHHRAPCSTANSNIFNCQPPTLSLVVNYWNRDRLHYVYYISAGFMAGELPLIWQGTHYLTFHWLCSAHCCFKPTKVTSGTQKVDISQSVCNLKLLAPAEMPCTCFPALLCFAIFIFLLSLMFSNCSLILVLKPLSCTGKREINELRSAGKVRQVEWMLHIYTL